MERGWWRCGEWAKFCGGHVRGTAPIFPWPAAPPATAPTSPAVHRLKPALPTPASAAALPPTPSPLWASLIDPPLALPASPSPSPTHTHTHAHQQQQQVWTRSRRGDGIHSGSGFFTAQPPGFFSGLRANRRGFATSPPATQAERAAVQTNGSRPLAGSPLFKDWNDLIASAPAPTFLPFPTPKRQRWDPSSGATGARRRVQRQTLTTREKHSFQDMFELLFSAMKQEKAARASWEGDAAPGAAPGEAGAEAEGAAGGGTTTLFSPGPRSADQYQYAFTAPPGLEPRSLPPTGPRNSNSSAVPAPLSDLDRLYGSLATRSRRLRGERSVSSQLAEEVDRKSEQMGLCENDVELLRYALDDVFPAPDESRPRAAYPTLLAGLMRTLRVKYGDPSLALAVFAYARGMSVPSYAFGCTTPAYNELLRTRWEGFKNLRATLDALEEMALNGVPGDRDTRAVVEAVRREVGANVSPEAARMIGRMEALVAASLVPEGEPRDLPRGKSPSALLAGPGAGRRDAGVGRGKARKAVGGQWAVGGGTHGGSSDGRDPWLRREGKGRGGRVDEWKYADADAAAAAAGTGAGVDGAAAPQPQEGPDGLPRGFGLDKYATDPPRPRSPPVPLAPGTGREGEGEQWSAAVAETFDADFDAQEGAGLGFEGLWEERKGRREARAHADFEPESRRHGHGHARGQGQAKGAHDRWLDAAVHDAAAVFPAPAPGAAPELSLGKGVVARPLPERAPAKFPMPSVWEEQGEYDLPEAGFGEDVEGEEDGDGDGKEQL
ncbi:hypothetical protein CALCODRAFT_555808 [Calocera cornea HHB12733]|uniref:Mtf2-like C-terminal domain-containing protein n=1 Tax=Calocera cornea HHB12733 TaxID=1353952 RepID=A0A165FF47_9BASI|nr:hypothetical protein CALCODRAFT_555808 [Calocera cornea HHB12733]